jgi:hypothetical protein
MILAMYFVVLTSAAAFLAIRAARLRARQHKSFRIYAASFGIVFGYLLAEFAVTTYYGLSWAGTSMWFFDESGKTMHFDPIRGYVLTEQPSRWGRITNGTFEYVAWLKGNSQGFPSRTDFSPARPDSSIRRIAVLGSSYSAGDYLDTNWPDRAQALAEAGGEQLQLLNFSLDGLGLANWWSILTRLVAPQNYELDGVVFVVSPHDLDRKFLAVEHRDRRRPRMWICQNWDPQTYPATLEQTKSCPDVARNAFIISDSEFEQALNKKWPPSVPRSELRPVLGKQIYEHLDRWSDSIQEALWKGPGFDPEQAHLIEDVRLFLSSRKLPAVVVFLPFRDRLVNSTWESDPYRAETQAFAKEIGAKFVDGSGAFANMQPADVRTCFFSYDLHWNQAGSDRFAKFMLDLIPQEFPNQLQASGKRTADGPRQAGRQPGRF